MLVVARKRIAIARIADGFHTQDIADPFAVMPRHDQHHILVCESEPLPIGSLRPEFLVPIPLEVISVRGLDRIDQLKFMGKLSGEFC